MGLVQWSYQFFFSYDIRMSHLTRKGEGGGSNENSKSHEKPWNSRGTLRRNPTKSRRNPTDGSQVVGLFDCILGGDAPLYGVRGRNWPPGGGGGLGGNCSPVTIPDHCSQSNHDERDSTWHNYPKLHSCSLPHGDEPGGGRRWKSNAGSPDMLRGFV